MGKGDQVKVDQGQPHFQAFIGQLGELELFAEGAGEPMVSESRSAT